MSPKSAQPNSAFDDLLTTAEVAENCRAPVSTVRCWRHIGTGPTSFKLGCRVLYRRTDVHSSIHSHVDDDVVSARALARSATR